MKTSTQALLALAALGALTFLAGRTRGPTEPLAVSRMDDASAAPVLRFPATQSLQYSIDFEQDSTADLLAEGSIHAMTRLAGTLQLQGSADGTVEARFMELNVDRLEIGGQNALEAASREALRTQRFYLRWAPSGRMTGVAFEPGAPETFVRLVQLLVSELSFELDAGARWERQEASIHGELATEYGALESNGALAIERRARLINSRWPQAALPQAIGGSRSAVWHPEGRWTSLTVDESFELRSTSGRRLQKVATTLAFTLIGASPAMPSSVISSTPRNEVDPTRIAVSDRAAARALEQRIDGLTAADFEASLKQAMIGGQAPDHNRFLWRASGLIEKDPSVIVPMKSAFTDPRTTHAGRALILDLLVGAGTEAAQSALLELVDSEWVTADPSRVHLRQRLALLPSYSMETVHFLEEKARAPDPWHEPARVAIGAAAHALRARGEDAVAARLGSYLAKALEDTSDARAIEVLLMALGNTKDPAYESAIRAHAGHVEGRVRFAVADALRSMPSDSAEASLLGLVGDTDPEVSRKALDTLRERLPLDEAAWGAIMSSLVSGRIPPTAFPELATLCGHAAKMDGPERQLLERLEVQPGVDVNLRARVRRMLSR